MHLLRASCSLLALLVPLAGCGGGGGPVLPPDDNNNIVANRNDAGVTLGADGGTVTDPDGGSTTNPDGGVVTPPAEPPALTAVAMHQAGRDGADILLTASGSDADGDLVAFVARFLDSAGTELMIADTDLDGDADSGYVIAGPDTSMDGETDFSASVTLRDLFLEFPDIARVEVFALDATSLASDVMQSNLTIQATVSLGDPCDPAYVDNRCAEGLGCKGEPTVCSDGEAPAITDFAYYTTNDGYRILIAGTDPDDDIWRVVLEFLDTSGAPVVLDLDNDGNPDSSTFEVDADGRSDNGTFYLALEPTQTFVDAVQGLAAVPYDTRQRQGSRLETTLRRPAPQRVGQSCDAWGFEVCNTGDVCFPGIAGESNSCTPVEGRRNRTCQDAPVLNPVLGLTKAAGVALGASLWDAPAGCAALDPKNRPEGVVNLDLPNGAQRVTLTTNLPGTGFNTVLYVVDGCAHNQDPILGCHDNMPGTINSELVLENLPAGRYLVVVDSWNIFGGAFEIEATVEE